MFSTFGQTSTHFRGDKIIFTSLSATGITRCSAWVNLGNINYIRQEYITLCTLGTSYITRAKH
jgi:hypothetical protein